MDDFGSILERDYGLFRPGKSGMRNAAGNRGSGRKARDVNFENSFRNSDSFGRSKFPHELGFRGGGKSSNSLNSRGGRPGDSFGTSHSIYDEVFASHTQSTIPLFEDVFRVPSSRMKVSELRDNDIFRGIPIFRKSSSRITYEDIFAEGIEDPSAPFVFNDVVASRLAPSSRTSSSGRQSPAQLGTPRKQSADSRIHQEFPWSAETRNGNLNEALKMPSTSYGSFLSMSGSFKPVEDTDDLGNASHLSSLRRPQLNGFSNQLVALVGETELKVNEDHHIITAESPADTGSARTWVTVDEVNLVTKPTENLPPSRVAPSLVGAQAGNSSDEPVLETSKVDSGPPPSRLPPPIKRRNPSDEPTAVEAPADLSHSSDLLDKVLKDRSMQVEKSSTEKVLAWQKRNFSQQAEPEEQVWESSKEENNQLVPIERQDSRRSATLVRLRTERAAIERIAAEVEEAAAEQAKVRAERAVLEHRERDARAMLVRQEGNMFRPNGADIEGYRPPKAFYEQTKVRSGREAEQPTFVEREVLSSGDDQRDEMAESDRHGKRVVGGAIEHQVARLIEEPERISSENDHRDEIAESEHQEKREDVGSGIQREVVNLNQDPVKGVEELHIQDSLASTIIGSNIAVDRTEEKGPVKRHDSFETNDSVGNMQQAAAPSNEEVETMVDSQTSTEEKYENVEYAPVIVKEHEIVAEAGIPTDANAAAQEHESLAGSYGPEEEAFKGTPMHTEQCESAEEATGVSVLTTNSEEASDSGSNISIDTISSFEGPVNDEPEPVQSVAKEKNGCRELAAERLEKEEEPAPETPDRMERSHASKKKAEKSSSEDAIESAWAEEANKTAAEERAKEEARRAAERSLVARITAEVRERAALEAKAKAEKAALEKKKKEARLKQEARVESRRTKLSSKEYVSEEVAKELEDHQAGPPKAMSRISLREQLERERQVRLQAEKQQLFKKEKFPVTKEAYGDTEAQRMEARLRAERTLAERITAEVRQRAVMTRAEKVATEKATTAAEQRGRLMRQEQEREEKEKLEKERERLEREQEREREIEREKDRINLERVAQEKAEAAAAAAEKAEAEAAARSQAEREAARIKMERAAVERATAEARARAERAAYERAEQQKANGTKSRPTSAPRQRFGTSASMPSTQQASENGGIRRTTSTANLDSDKYSNSQLPRDFQDLKGETPERRKARLERHQRTLDRAAKALAQKNQRDLELQSEQAERQRLAERLEAEIKRWSAGKDGNIRALLSTLQYVLWSDSGWKQVPLTELVSPAAVKKAYRRATLCVHPDKMQQKRANVQQKYIAEKVFNILQVAWNKFNSQENV